MRKFGIQDKGTLVSHLSVRNRIRTFGRLACFIPQIRLQFLVAIVAFAAASIAFAEPQIDLSKFIACHSIIIVRHAEFDESKTKGPLTNLTADGTNRAVELANILQDFKITKIIVSDHIRTVQTAQFVAKSHNLVSKPDIKHDDPVAKTINQIRNDIGPNDDVLIVYHHTKIPDLIYALTQHESKPKIEEKQFDNLFILI